MKPHARLALRPLPILISLALGVGLVACGSNYALAPTVKGQVIGS